MAHGKNPWDAAWAATSDGSLPPPTPAPLGEPGELGPWRDPWFNASPATGLPVEETISPRNWLTDGQGAPPPPLPAPPQVPGTEGSAVPMPPPRPAEGASVPMDLPPQPVAPPPRSGIEFNTRADLPQGDSPIGVLSPAQAAVAYRLGYDPNGDPRKNQAILEHLWATNFRG